jgi:hypothetical protein
MRAWKCQNTPHAISDRSKNYNLLIPRHTTASRAPSTRTRLRHSSTQSPKFHQDGLGRQQIQCRSSASRASPAPVPESSSQASSGAPQPVISALPPLPSLPIDRGDNTFQRTVSGIVLGVLGSLCIYSGGLLFTGGFLAISRAKIGSRL